MNDKEQLEELLKFKGYSKVTDNGLFEWKCGQISVVVFDEGDIVTEVEFKGNYWTEITHTTVKSFENSVRYIQEFL